MMVVIMMSSTLILNVKTVINAGTLDQLGCFAKAASSIRLAEGE